MLEPVEEALEGAQGILKDLEFGVNGMLAPLNPQLQGLLPLDRSHDKFFQLRLSEVLTVLQECCPTICMVWISSALWHGFPSLRIRLTCPRRKTFAFCSACDVGNKVQNCNSCTSLPGTCTRSPAANLFPLSLLGTSLCGWRPFRRVGTLTASPQLLITLPLGTL